MPTNITDVDFGTYRMRTASGSTYLIDIRPEASTVTRLPIEDSPDEHYGPSVLRRDGEALPLLGIIRARGGASAAFWVDVRRDGIRTLRLTTPVLSIDSDDDPREPERDG